MLDRLRKARQLLPAVAIPLTLCLLSPDAARSEATVIHDVNVLPMDGSGLLRNRVVIIEDGRISAITSSKEAKLPSSRKNISGKGKYLIPGLSDMHAHIKGHQMDVGGKSRLAIESAAENQFLLYLASGVTLLRDPAGSLAHFYYRQSIASGDILGPELVFTSPILEGANNLWPDSVIEEDPDNIDALFLELKQQGFWGVKLYHTISLQVYEAAIAAAHRHDLKVVGHIPFSVGIDRALELQQYSIEHLRGYDFDGMDPSALIADGGRSAERFNTWLRMTNERREELVAKTVQSGAINVPTLTINRFLYDSEGRSAISKHKRFESVHPIIQMDVLDSVYIDEIFSAASRDALRAATPAIDSFVKLLSNAGAPLLIGTDSPLGAFVPGFTVADEMLAFQRAGIKPERILRYATIDAARSVGLEQSMGSIEPGKWANMALLGSNPLTNIAAVARPEGVFLRGQWLPLNKLEAMLEAQRKGWGPEVPAQR